MLGLFAVWVEGGVASVEGVIECAPASSGSWCAAAAAALLTCTSCPTWNSPASRPKPSLGPIAKSDDAGAHSSLLLAVELPAPRKGGMSVPARYLEADGLGLGFGGGSGSGGGGGGGGGGASSAGGTSTVSGIPGSQPSGTVMLKARPSKSTVNSMPGQQPARRLGEGCATVSGRV